MESLLFFMHPLLVMAKKDAWKKSTYTYKYTQLWVLTFFLQYMQQGDQETPSGRCYGQNLNSWLHRVHWIYRKPKTGSTHTTAYCDHKCTCKYTQPWLSCNFIGTKPIGGLPNYLVDLWNLDLEYYCSFHSHQKRRNTLEFPAAMCCWVHGKGHKHLLFSGYRRQ